MRLIDADALEEDFIHHHPVGDGGLIAKAPTIEERPKGKWIYDGIYHDNDNPIDNDMYRCSLCKRSIITALTNPTELFPYCHCGADMRGE